MSTYVVLILYINMSSSWFVLSLQMVSHFKTRVLGMILFVLDMLLYSYVKRLEA